MSFYTPKLFLEAVELCFLVRENVGKCSDDKHFFSSEEEAWQWDCLSEKVIKQELHPV